MLTDTVKVVMKGSTVFLEKAKYITKKGRVFLSGYEIDKSGDPVSKKGDILHLIEIGTEDHNKFFKLGQGAPKVYAMAYNPTYCELEYANIATGYWEPGLSKAAARIH